MITVRLAMPEDLRAFAGRDPPEWCIESVSYVAEQDGRPIALGTVYWDRWGRVWGTFDKKDDISPFLMHRLAKRTIVHMRSVGIERVYAHCDEHIPGAMKWLERLGFKREGEAWVCDLST